MRWLSGIALGVVALAPTPLSPRWNDADWHVLDSKVRWAIAQRLDTLPLGTAIARLGETFVGTSYTPGTLEAPGPEHLVIDLREFDCVTFIENLLALTRFIRHDGIKALADRAAAEARYAGYLEELRYRGGHLDGYASRLHYFSEWLSDNAQRGKLELLTRELGGVPDSEPFSFMSTHAAAYRQMAEPGVADQIRAMEGRLDAALPRWYIPEDHIAAIAPRIHDGDIIAATSTLPGLDIAHTGIALWKHGALHLLHAPLVGKSVEISAVPLAQRILDIKTQDGIMVARVLR
jgi:hypothetical protein